jgi:hypothetical protein
MIPVNRGDQKTPLAHFPNKLCDSRLRVEPENHDIFGLLLPEGAIDIGDAGFAILIPLAPASGLPRARPVIAQPPSLIYSISRSGRHGANALG